MTEEWPVILRQLTQRRDTWESRENPLFHPRTFATQIAEAAKDDLEQLVKETVQTKLRPVIEDRMSAAQRRLHLVLAALSAAGFGSLGELERRLNTSVIEHSFSDSGDELVGGNVTGLAITASVSTVVGYIVADLVLFYVLGVISGFLNPLLLAAAATVGAVTYLVAGKAAVTSWIRASIADKLEEKLVAPEVSSKVARAAEEATLEQFSKFADEYLTQLDRIVKGAKQSLGEAVRTEEQQRQKLRETVGTMQSARSAIEAMAQSLEDEISNLQDSRENHEE
jgi:hypothetical protein